MHEFRFAHTKAFLDSYYLVEITGVLGFIVTVVGFCVTIWNVRKSRLVAEEIRSRIYHIDTVVELGSVLTSLEEVKNLMRNQIYAHVPHRLSGVRTKLVSIRAQSSSLADADKSLIQGAITYLANFEKKIDRLIENGSKPTNWSRDNAIVTEHIDKMAALLMRLKVENGGAQ